MLTIGCHLPIAKGYLEIYKTASGIGADTFQYFTRNPRGGAVKALDEKDLQSGLEYGEAHGIVMPLAHAPYTLNLCSNKESVREFARTVMAEDIARTDMIPGAMYNFHPGSHVGQGVEAGITQICEILNEVIRAEQSTVVLLETMSGKGSEIGGSFEELREIIDRTDLSDKLKVCLDTCHVYDAGYDIVKDLDGVITEFDRVIGLQKLAALHLNDSKNSFASHKDRHETIGNGSLGLETFRRVINHPALRGLPFYLETPNELPGYESEIKVLRSMFV